MKNIFKTLGISSLAIFAVIVLSCNNDDNSPIPAANCIPTSLQNGIIASYTFANGSLNDSSGNGYHLTNSTSASSDADRAGNANCAFHFTKANGEYLEYVNPTFLDNIQTQTFTISLWYKNKNTSLNDYELLIGRDIGLHCPNTYGQWSLGLYDLRKPNFGMNQYSTNWNSNPINSISVTPSQWRHLVVTSDGNIDFKIYLDNVLTSTLVDPTLAPCGPLTSNIGNLYLGKDFDGFLDDIVIYNRILTQAEITQLYNLAPCCS